MPARSLPEDPSLENLKKRVKRLYKQVRAGDAEAVALVREFHPRAEAALAGFSLADAQLVAARGYGFASWPKLKQHLDAVGRFIWHPPAPKRPRSPVDTFIRLSCLDYGVWLPSNAEEARQLLAEHPELARANIYAAAAAGDVDAVRAALAREPSLVNTKGGPLQWEPLLYACYSRLNSADPNHSTLAVARLLLESGADPNAGFLWRGNIPPFTALTGAFGEGEDGQNQPPHQHRDALARLLLDAGADPNDEQTLYNRHFNRDDGHLELLFPYGLGRDKGGPWFRRLEQMHSPATIVAAELWSAARKSYFGRVKLLVGHGADVNAPGWRNGRTAYEEALMAGNLEIAEYLLQHGARKIELDRKDRLVAACIAGRRDEASALLRQEPAILEQLGPEGRAELLHRVVDANRPETIRFMVDNGFDVNGTTHNTPLHDAAIAGNLEMVKLLIELGADPTIRDPIYNATPLGWAEHSHQQHVIDYLTALSASR